MSTFVWRKIKILRCAKGPDRLLTIFCETSLLLVVAAHCVVQFGFYPVVRFSHLLWPPYGIGQAIIFHPVVSFYLLSIFYLLFFLA